MAMTVAKLQVGAIVVAACLIIAVPAVVVATRHAAAPTSPVAEVPVAATPVADATPPTDDPEAAFALKPEQLIAHFPNPPAEVHDVYERKHQSHGGHLMFAYSEDRGLVEMGYMTGSAFTVQGLLGQTVGINRQDIDSSASFGPELWPVKGDVVYRPGAKPEEYVAALQQLVQDELHIKAKMTLRNVDHKVIVLRGKWTHDPMLDENPRNPQIRLMQGDAPADGVYPKYPTAYYAGAGQESLAAALGSWIDEPVIVECEGFPKQVELKYYNQPMTALTALFSPKSTKEALLQQLTTQTGLTWTEEVRNVRRLMVEVSK